MKYNSTKSIFQVVGIKSSISAGYDGPDLGGDSGELHLLLQLPGLRVESETGVWWTGAAPPDCVWGPCLR